MLQISQQNRLTAEHTMFDWPLGISQLLGLFGSSPNILKPTEEVCIEDSGILCMCKKRKADPNKLAAINITKD